MDFFSSMQKRKTERGRYPLNVEKKMSPAKDKEILGIIIFLLYK